jgi:transcriptional regulator with XRE-family HTH domain
MSNNWVKKEVGLRVKKLRKEIGYNQEQLSQLMNLTRTSIINIESGRHGLGAESIYTMCRILKCMPNDLFPAIKSVRVEVKHKTIIKKIIKAEYRPVKKP